eukprot:scaffold72069_cov51-Phaeocystis_antarctica.AAC.1
MARTFRVRANGRVSQSHLFDVSRPHRPNQVRPALSPRPCMEHRTPQPPSPVCPHPPSPAAAAASAATSPLGAGARRGAGCERVIVGSELCLVGVRHPLCLGRW